MRIEHPNPDVFATRLLLPAVGGRERIGVFYCLGGADESSLNKISTILMDRNGKTPSEVTLLPAESIILEV